MSSADPMKSSANMDRTSSKRDHSNSTKRQLSRSTHSNKLATVHEPTTTAPRNSAILTPQAFGATSPQSKHFFMDNCEFRPSPVQGYGVFASKDIKPGTMIIKEKALWVVSASTAIEATCSESHSDYREARVNMIRSFSTTSCPDLDKETRELLQNDMLSLRGGFSAEEKVDGSTTECEQKLSQHLREILILNGATDSFGGKPDYVAVFQAFSRLNHSCAPNAVSSTSKLDDGSVVSYRLFRSLDLPLPYKATDTDFTHSGAWSRVCRPSKQARRFSSTTSTLWQNSTSDRNYLNRAGASLALAMCANVPRRKSRPQTTDARRWQTRWRG